MIAPASSRQRILGLIREKGRISRVEIAAATGISRAAVTNLTQALLDDGLLIEQAGDGAAAGRGRPRVNLQLNSRAMHVVGVKISMHQIGIALTDFTGEVLDTLIMPYRAGRQAADVTADVVEDAVRQCLLDSSLAPSSVGGICIGLPGYVDSEAGVCHWSPIFKSGDVRFGDEIQRRMGIDTYIENDANLVASAEHWFGKGRGRDCFAVVTVEAGVGMGFVVNDTLYRGAHGVGPEFGHAQLDPHGPQCRCGRRGCVEAYVSDYAILREADGGISIDAYAANPTLYHGRINEITRQARDGDERLREVFQKAGRSLGFALANLVAMLNPPRIILSGDGMRAGELLFDPVREGLADHRPTAPQFEVDLVTHRWGDDVWARGAAAMVLQRLYSRSELRAVGDAAPSKPAPAGD